MLATACDNCLLEELLRVQLKVEDLENDGLNCRDGKCKTSDCVFECLTLQCLQASFARSILI